MSTYRFRALLKGNDRPGEQRRYVLVGTTAMNMYVGLTLEVERRPIEGVAGEMERAVVSAECNTATVICKRWLAISFLFRMFGISSPQISEIIFLDRKSLFLGEMKKKNYRRRDMDSASNPFEFQLS